MPSRIRAPCSRSRWGSICRRRSVWRGEWPNDGRRARNTAVPNARNAFQDGRGGIGARSPECDRRLALSRPATPTILGATTAQERVRRSPHGHFQHRQGDAEPRQVVRARRMGGAATRGLRGALRAHHRQPRLARRCPRRASRRGGRHAERVHPRGLLHRPVRRARRAQRHRRLSQAPRLARIGARQALPGGAEGLHRVPLRGRRHRYRTVCDGADSSSAARW